MHLIDAAATARMLAPLPLVDALQSMFRHGCTMPIRHHHTIPVPGEPDGTLLLMPAWSEGDYLGVKLANVFPGNSARSEPAVAALYVLMSARTGRPLALIDGGELTARRTAATSALAARFLARPDSRRLLMVGTGRLARHLVRFHRAVLPGLEHVALWGRHPERVEALMAELAADGIQCEFQPDLDGAAAAADVISCATLATAPLIRGAVLKAGTHVDLVGGFTPDMREADDEVIRRASVFVDTIAGATKEAGDIVAPLASGLLSPGRITDLFALCRDERPGRRSAQEITLFKSVGAALEDLAAAILVHDGIASGRDAGTAQVRR